jgi:hypothetical protein
VGGVSVSGVSGGAGADGAGSDGAGGGHRPSRVRVRVSSHLHAYTKGAAEVEVDLVGEVDEAGGTSGRDPDGGTAGGTSGSAAVTLDHVLRALDLRSPGIRFRLVDEQDRLRPHMSFFVGGERVRSLAAPVAPGEEVCLLGALSGG